MSEETTVTGTEASEADESAMSADETQATGEDSVEASDDGN